LTVAVPLYRSARFLHTIEENLAILSTMPDVEVLISDRHMFDDALERLHSNYCANPRFQFLCATDKIDWVAHYNWLLSQGRGEYFAWMPHDDTFPMGYYSGLVAHLDKRAKTLLAFGPMILVDDAGQNLEWADYATKPPPWQRRLWSVRHAYSVLSFHPWVPFRGVFRREQVVEANLTIQPSLHNQSADIGWVFGVGLRGQIRFVPVAACVKRHYSTSTHRTTMPFSIQSMSSHYARLVGYSLRHSPSRFQAVIGLSQLAWMYFAKIISPRLFNRTMIKSLLI
jgi:hypothetical protein